MVVHAETKGYFWLTLSIVQKGDSSPVLFFVFFFFLLCYKVPIFEERKQYEPRVCVFFCFIFSLFFFHPSAYCFLILIYSSLSRDLSCSVYRTFSIITIVTVSFRSQLKLNTNYRIRYSTVGVCRARLFPVHNNRMYIHYASIIVHSPYMYVGRYIMLRRLRIFGKIPI